MELKNRIAVITGANKGIGLECAKLLLEEGSIVYGICRSSCDFAHSNFHIIQADVQVFEELEIAFNNILKQNDKIDILINNAGITQPVKTLDIQRNDYDRILDVSLRGTLIMSQAVIPSMKANGGGSIVCLSSVSAQRGGGIFGGPHYSAAKAGVLGLAKAMAREFGGDQIRVNSLTPGLIQTDITGGLMNDDRRHDILAGIPLGRLGKAQDVANAALFLASDLSAYLTGVTLDVNGGMLIH